MKDEIKKLFPIEFYIKKDKMYAEVSLENLNKIVDYITNLQNGFKSTVEELCETTEKFEKLQEKYEKMKENAEILSRGYSDLEKRNEKAIEILEQDKASASFNTAEIIALNTLQGSDKDE